MAKTGSQGGDSQWNLSRRLEVNLFIAEQNPCLTRRYHIIVEALVHGYQTSSLCFIQFGSLTLTLFSWLLLAKEPLTSRKLHHHYLLWDEISCDIFVVVVVQSLNRVWLFVIPWTSAHQAPLSSTVSQSSLKVISIESVMLSNHLILCSPLSFAFKLSQHQDLFQWVSSSIRWPKFWSFSFSISPSTEYSGFISFCIDCFDLFAVQGPSSVFSSTTVWRHQFFSAQSFLLSSSHIPTWLLEKP